jgi:predicted RNA-binding protein associated with RNAse of E/G family
MQEPVVRTRLGFDYRDLQLDILVDPNREWRWKDIDDLERSVERGVISSGHAERAWAEGRKAVEDIEAGRWPFTDEWRDWRPDPGWPRLELPPGPLTDLPA